MDVIPGRYRPPDFEKGFLFGLLLAITILLVVVLLQQRQILSRMEPPDHGRRPLEK